LMSKDRTMNMARLSQVILALCIPLIIWLACAGYQVFDSSFYESQFAKNDVYAAQPLADIMTGGVRSYFISGDTDRLAASGFSSREISHLIDVRSIIGHGACLLALALLFSAMAIAYIIRHDRTAISKRLFQPIFAGALLCLLPLLVLPVLASRFMPAFDIFHSILFAKGTWLFPKDSLLITLFPVVFFKEALLSIFIRAVSADFLLLTGLMITGKKLYQITIFR